MEAADKDSKALQGTKNIGVHKVVESRMVLPAKQPSGSNILATDVGRQIIFLPNVNLWELFAETVAKLDILLQCVSQEKEQILKTDRKILQPDFLQIQGLIMLRQTRLVIPQLHFLS